MNTYTMLALCILTLGNISDTYSLPILLARYSRTIIDINGKEKKQYVDIIGDYCPTNQSIIKENFSDKQRCSLVLFSESLNYLKGPKVYIETEYPLLPYETDLTIPKLVRGLSGKSNITIRPISSNKQNSNGLLTTPCTCEPSLSYLENNKYSENIIGSDGIYLCTLQNKLNTTIETEPSGNNFNAIHDSEVLSRLWEITSSSRPHHIIYTTIERAQTLADHFEHLQFQKRDEKRSIPTPLTPEEKKSFIDQPKFLLFEDLEGIEFQALLPSTQS